MLIKPNVTNLVEVPNFDPSPREVSGAQIRRLQGSLSSLSSTERRGSCKTQCYGDGWSHSGMNRYELTFYWCLLLYNPLCTTPIVNYEWSSYFYYMVLYTSWVFTIVYIYIYILIIPGNARPAPGRKFQKNEMVTVIIRNQWLRGKFLRCRSNEVFKLWGASRNGKIGCGWWQRNGMSESMNQCNESTKQWINVSINYTQSGKSAHRLFENNHNGTLRRKSQKSVHLFRLMFGVFYGSKIKNHIVDAASMQSLF